MDGLRRGGGWASKLRTPRMRAGTAPGGREGDDMSSVPRAEVDGQPEQEPEGEHGEEDEEQGLGRAKLEQRCDAAKQEQLNEQEEEGLGATGGGVVVHGRN